MKKTLLKSIFLLLITGTISLSAKAGGPWEAAMYVNGDGYAAIGGSPTLNNFTYEFDIKWNGVSVGSYDRFFSIQGDIFDLATTAGGDVKIYSSELGINWTQIPYVLPQGTWCHFAVVRNVNLLLFYKNGAIEYSMTIPSGDPINCPNMYIGASGSDFNENTIATFDNFRMWNVARTSQEIATNYAVCATGNESGLIRLYNFNEGISTINDLAVNDGAQNGSWGTTSANGHGGVYPSAVAGVICGSPCISPSIYSATAMSSTICPETTTSITANAVSGTNAVLGWYDQPNGMGNYLGNTSSIDVYPGTYYAYVTGDCGAAETSVTVGTFEESPVSVTGNNNICAGSSTTLTASNASSYLWSNGATTSSISVSPSASTNYSVVGTSVNGCQSEAAIMVTVKALPSITITGDAEICEGSSTNLSATGATSYLWNTGATTTGIAVSPSVNTNYTVTGTGSNGCTKEESRMVVVNSLPEISITGNNLVCAGSTTTLTASGGSSYEWSNGAVTASTQVTPSTNTTYTVMGTNPNGCTNTASLLVTIKTLPNVSVAGDNAICVGTQNELLASGADSYAWLNGPSSDVNIVSPTTTTTYYVTGTGSNGCTKTVSKTVTVNPLPSVSASASPTTIGAGQSSTLSASGASNYSWSNGASGSVINVTPSGTSSYTVTGTTNGCSSTASVNVVVTGAGSSLSFDGVNDYVKIANPFRAFTNAITVEWWVNLGSTFAVGSGIGQSSENVDATATNVWLMHVNADRSIYWGVTPNTGTAGLALTSPLATGWHHVAGVVDASGTRIYVDGVLSSTSGAGLTNGQTINYSPNSVIHLGKDVRYATGRFMGGNIDEVRVWNRALCASEISAHKNCQLVGAQNGLVEYYKFNQGAAAGNNPTITSLEDNSGNSRNGVLNGFALAGTTSNWVATGGVASTSGCGAIAITASIVKTDVICNGAATGTATVTASGGCEFTYEWSNGATTAAITGLAAGTYTCYISNASGATKTVSTTITQGSAIAAAANVTKPILSSGATGAITLTVTGGTSPYTYSWSNGATTKDLTGLMIGTYTVTITDSKGCTFVKVVLVEQATTKLTAAYCGSSLPALTSDFWCEVVTGATNYEYEFTDVATNVVTTKVSATSAANMTLPTALAVYGKTYDVRVRAKSNGSFGSFGAVCQLSTAGNITSTKLTTATCGITLATPSSAFWCDIVSGASNYEYEFTDVATSVVTTKLSPSSASNMSLPVALALYGKTYDVRVRAKVGAAFGSFGTVCQVITPASIPATKLTTAYCGVTLATPASAFWCDVVNAASNYEYEFTDVATSVVTTKLSASSGSNMSLPAALAVAGKTYDVRVRAKSNGSFGPFGTPCQITTPSGARLANPFETNATEETNLTMAKEQVLLQAYPNPSNGTFTLQSNRAGKYMLMNELGEVIKTYTLSNENNNTQLIEGLQAGLYIIVSNQAEGTVSHKIIVTK